MVGIYLKRTEYKYDLELNDYIMFDTCPNTVNTGPSYAYLFMSVLCKHEDLITYLIILNIFSNSIVFIFCWIGFIVVYVKNESWCKFSTLSLIYYNAVLIPIHSRNKIICCLFYDLCDRYLNSIRTAEDLKVSPSIKVDIFPAHLHCSPDKLVCVSHGIEVVDNT